LLLALRDGFRLVRRSWGLVFLILASNLLVAAVLAVPLQRALEAELSKKDAASRMLEGFDYRWWSEWSSRQTGWTGSFGPEIFGVGFAFRNLELLLGGQLPARLPARLPAGAEEPNESADGVILGLGVLYLLLQTFLTGGILAVFRGSQGEWRLRGFLHGSGFYFGRLLRVGLLALAIDLLLFRLNVPLARWVDAHAREAVSELTASAWLFGRYAALLLALLLVHVLSGYAKVIVVLEERSSALLAFLSSVGFCARHAAKVLGLLLAIVALSVLLLLSWSFLDSHSTTAGYASQAVALLIAEGLVLGRIALRLAFLGGQVALYRSSEAPA
jgi:hypothetical protein